MPYKGPKGLVTVPANKRRRKRPRPQRSIDPELVVRAASIRCTREEIANLCGVGLKTLYRFLHDNPEVQDRVAFVEAKANASLRRRQWKAAMKGDRALMIWLGKQHLGQRDVRAVELTGKEGGPIEVAESWVAMAKVALSEELEEEDTVH